MGYPGPCRTFTHWAWRALGRSDNGLRALTSRDTTKKPAFYKEKEVRGIGNGARQSEPIVHSAHTKPTEVMKELRESR